MLWMALGWLAGTAAQLQQAQLWPLGVYAFLAMAGVGALAVGLTRRVGSRAPLALVLGCGAVAFALTGLRAGFFAAGALNPALEGQDLQLTGIVAAMPHADAQAVRLRLSVEQALKDGQPVQVPALVALSWYAVRDDAAATAAEASLPQPLPRLYAGERWRLMARLKAPHGNANPFGFDYELWLWQQGVQATAYVRAGARDPPPQRLAQTWHHPIEWLRQRARDRVETRLGPSPEAAVVKALALGDQAAMARADWELWRNTGVAHLMSVSGLHVGMFAWMAALLAGWGWRLQPRLCLLLAAPTVAELAGVGAALGYALFSGWGVPSQRTVVMLAAIALLRLGGQRWPWPVVWLWAAVAVLALDPWALLQAGFWLSFVAVGILFASNLGANNLYPERISSTFSLGKRVLALLRQQALITLALAPLTLLLFNQVSLVGLLANLIAIPLVSFVVLPLTLLGLVYAPIWSFASAVVHGLLWLLHLLVAWPWATLTLPTPPLPLALLGLGAALLGVMRVPWQMRVLGAAMALPAVLWQAPRPTPGAFEVTAVDIGQGNAVVVRTASHTLLYDTGPKFSQESDAGQRILVPLLQAMGERLDTLVLSHRDSDHTGGALAVLQAQPQVALLSSVEDTHALQRMRPVQRCLQGQSWKWDGVEFAVLHPQPADYQGQPKPNALSCVLRISNGNQTALLVADLEAPQEARLVAQGAPLRADLLLVPHHGSKTSSSPGFLDAVQPYIALLQTGYRNRYGHPVPAVMERYRQRNIAVFATESCGAVVWKSLDSKQVVCYRHSTKRYWQHNLPLDSSLSKPLAISN